MNGSYPYIPIWAQLLLNSYHFTDTVFSALLRIGHDSLPHQMQLSFRVFWPQKVGKEIVWIAGLFAVFFFSSIVHY